MKEMYLMCGLSGSGKTTLAKHLAKQKGLIYLSIDDVYAEINGDAKLHTNKFNVWIEFWCLIHAHEVLGHSVMIDTNCLTYVDRVQFLEWFPSFDRYYLFYVYTPFNVCCERNRTRERVVPLDQMIEQKNREEFPFMDEDSRWYKIFYYNSTAKPTIEHSSKVYKEWLNDRKN